MNLTLFTDYSLRTLMYVAVKPKEELSTIEEIAMVYGISRNHLTKAVYRLSKLGLLQTIRGRHGGFRLAQDPKNINLGWVVRQTEENWNMVECFDEESGFCVLNPACRLKGVLAKAMNAYFEVLNNVTLQDLLMDRRQFQTIIEKPANTTK